MQDEEGGKAGEDWLEGEEDRGAGGGKVLLRPALDGEGGGGGEQAGDGECDQKARRDCQVWSSACGEGDCHECCRYTDLEGGELAGGDLRGDVRQGDQVAGKGERAGHGKHVAEADAGEEIIPGGSRWRGEEKEAVEGQENADCSGPARSWCLGGTKGRDDCEKRNEDDNQASDER